MKVSLRISDDNRDTIEVEASEEVAVTIRESYRQEDNQARKWRYHHVSYDIIGEDMDSEGRPEKYEGMELADLNTPEMLHVEKDESAESEARYRKALALLTDVQRERFLMYAAGLSTHEIARRQGADQKSVHESIEAARKKLKQFYANTPSKRPSNLPTMKGH